MKIQVDVDVNPVNEDENSNLRGRKSQMQDRFAGLDEFDKLLIAAERSAAEYDFAHLPKDSIEFKAAREAAWDLIHNNDIEALLHAIDLNGSVAQLLRIWSEDDNLADEYDGLLNIRVILIANKAKREIGGK